MQLLGKVARFVLFGIPAFLIAIPLNFFLVETLLWPKQAAYALVLLVQVTINFFICIRFVFNRDPNKNMASQLNRGASRKQIPISWRFNHGEAVSRASQR